MTSVGAGVQGGASQVRNQEATVWVGGIDEQATEGKQQNTTRGTGQRSANILRSILSFFLCLHFLMCLLVSFVCFRVAL